MACLALFAMASTSHAQTPAAPGASEALAVTPPVLSRNVEPVYPPEALRMKRTAFVLLLLDLDADGNVTAATVKTPAGYGFDEAAQQAALQLGFVPATRQRRNVPCRILYRMTFELTPSDALP